MRIGVIGLGRAFTLMLPTFRDDTRVELVAACDPRPEARAQFRRDFHGNSYASVEELVAVGDTGSDKTSRTRTKPPSNPALADLAAALSDELETRVTVDLGRSKGKIIITFASVDDLERIVDVIAPRSAQALRGAS